MDADEHVITERLSKLNTELARLLPDPSKGVDRLWKFAKMHDRRSYQLIRFCLAQDSDFHTIQKAIVSNLTLVHYSRRLIVLYRKSSLSASMLMKGLLRASLRL